MTATRPWDEWLTPSALAGLRATQGGNGMVDEQIRAIPTTVDGITYKSRLEARFAQWAMTRLREFDNETGVYYEPHRLGSDQYLPDFLFVAPGSVRIYIEVKPIRFSEDAWLAINAVCETDHSLMVVDAFDRNQWYCYASVSGGVLDFYSSLKEHACRLIIPDKIARPIYLFRREASRNRARRR